MVSATGSGSFNYWLVQHRIIIVLTFFLFFIKGGIYANNNGLQKEDLTNLITKTIDHQGIKRTYHIYLPKGFSKNNPAPMVLALHGGGGIASKFEKHTTNGTLTQAADKRGVVLVFPQGKGKQWNDGRKEIFRKKKKHDDVGFISKIIDKMINDYGIDEKRVYATGISNGGFMSVRLAIDLSDKIAAVAPVTAQLSKALKDSSPEFPVSIMIVNGTDDPLVPFNGGEVKVFKFSRSRGEVLSASATIDHFIQFNNCDIQMERDVLPDKDPNDETTVVIENYANCKDETSVILVKVKGGGHTWPGGKQYLRPRIVGVVSKEINASEMILDFFLRHSRE